MGVKEGAGQIVGVVGVVGAGLIAFQIYQKWKLLKESAGTGLMNSQIEKRSDYVADESTTKTDESITDEIGNIATEKITEFTQSADLVAKQNEYVATKGAIAEIEASISTLTKSVNSAQSALSSYESNIAFYKEKVATAENVLFGATANYNKAYISYQSALNAQITAQNAYNKYWSSFKVDIGYVERNRVQSNLDKANLLVDQVNRTVLALQTTKDNAETALQSAKNELSLAETDKQNYIATEITPIQAQIAANQNILTTYRITLSTLEAQLK